MDYRQYLKRRYHNKNEVGNRVQLASELARTVCFSGDCTIYHIAKTAQEIYDKKAEGKCRKEQQQNTAENTTTSEYICKMLRHLFTYKFKFVDYLTSCSSIS